MKKLNENKALLFAFAAVALSATLVGCGQKSGDNKPAPAATLDTQARTEENVAISDQMIVNHLAYMDRTERSVADLAMARGESADLKSLASTLIADHEKANAELTALAQKLNLTIDENPSDNNSVLAAERTFEANWIDRLNSLSGHEFDLEFAKFSADSHKRGIEKLDGFLAATQTADLHDFLARTQETMRSHLDMSVALLDRLEGTTTGTPGDSQGQGQGQDQQQQQGKLDEKPADQGQQQGQEQGKVDEKGTPVAEQGKGQEQGKVEEKGTPAEQGKDQGKVAPAEQGKDQGKVAEKGAPAEQGKDQGKVAPAEQGKSQEQGKVAEKGTPAEQGKDQGKVAPAEQGKDQGKVAPAEQGKDQGKVAEKGAPAEQGKSQEQGQEQGKDQGKGTDQGSQTVVKK